MVSESTNTTAAQTPEDGGVSSLPAETLRTRGLALARAEKGEEALAFLRRAVEVAEQAGDSDEAGRAALTLVEELGWRLGQSELTEMFGRADAWLSKSQHPDDRERLLECARRVLLGLGARSGPETWRGFSFNEAVRRFEGRLLERALYDAGGVITEAAKLLGIKRQSLSSMLHTRHRELLPPRPAAGARGRQPPPAQAAGIEENRGDVGADASAPAEEV
jgi:Bacterial regulatory protein, Fis family